MSKLIATIGLGLILASTAANAAAPAAKPADKAPASEKQYCLKFADDTGSHLTRTECRTKREWKRLGVDLDNPSEN